MHLVIGSVISTWRTTAGLTQEQLAEKLSVSAQAVSNWENGKNQPSVEKLYQLAEVLEIPFSTLIGESTDPLSFDWELKERGDSLQGSRRSLSTMDWKRLTVLSIMQEMRTAVSVAENRNLPVWNQIFSFIRWK